MEKEKKKEWKSPCGPFWVVQVMAFDREKYSNNRDWQILESLAIDICKFLRSFSKPHLKIIQDTTQICWVTISGLCWLQQAQTYVKIEI